MMELLTLLGPGFLALLTGIGAWLKGHSEVQKVRKEREETKKRLTQISTDFHRFHLEMKCEAILQMR